MHYEVSLPGALLGSLPGFVFLLELIRPAALPHLLHFVAQQTTGRGPLVHEVLFGRFRAIMVEH
jgi:hypothetical protein